MIYNQQVRLFNYHFHQIIFQFPGVIDNDDNGYYQDTIPLNRLAEMFQDTRKIQFIRPRQTLKSMCSPAMTLRNILDGKRDADAYKELVKNLKNFPFSAFTYSGDETQRQLWRMQDLRDVGGLGCTVELFFLALDQLLSHIVVEGIPLCAVHGRISNHYI